MPPRIVRSRERAEAGGKAPRAGQAPVAGYGVEARGPAGRSLGSGRIPNAQAVADAVEILAAQAEFEGPEREVFVRVAGNASRVLIDLADDSWCVVEVRPSGWRIVDPSPVPFVRGAATAPMPEPVGGGSVDELRCSPRRILRRDHLRHRSAAGNFCGAPLQRA
jgi:hypothetical protein